MDRHFRQATRVFAPLLLAALLLTPVFLLAHEVEHVSYGDNHGCLTCQVADHQQHALTPPPLVISSSQSIPVLARPIYSHTPSPLRHFATRAPPLQA